MKITNRQAIEAQMALINLITVSMPIKTSFDFALLSAAIDRQVVAFAKVRDADIKKYKIDLKAGEKDNSIVYTTLIGGEESEESKKLKEKALTDFTDRMNELMTAEGEDISIMIALPPNLDLRPDWLKPILGFVTMGGASA